MTCAHPGCAHPVKAKGLCRNHYQREWAKNNQPRPGAPAPGPSIRPHRPKRVTDALHALAESNPTPTEYERRKRQILEGARS